MRGLGPSTEDELPKSIIVTNVDTSVFDNPQLKVSCFYSRTQMHVVIIQETCY